MKLIFPNPILVIEGGLLLCLFSTIPCCLWYTVLFESPKDGWIIGIMAIAFSVCDVWFFVCFGHHIFPRILITRQHIIFYGLFLPIVKIKFEDIKYIEIRSFNKGNVMRNHSNNIDSYKFILLSSLPIPQKRVDKIRSSRKQALIKFPVSYKLCQALAEHIEQPSPINYQLLLYKQAKK